MIDPISTVALASGAFKTIKAAISTGKDLESMGKTFATWGKACSDFNKAEDRNKNPPWWQKTFKGSDEEEAIMIWNQRRKMDEMRKALKDEISFYYGPSAWEEILRIEAEQRKRRKQEAYERQEFIDNVINTIIVVVSIAVVSAVAFGLVWIMKERGVL